MPRLVADDITVEAAASLLAEQGGRLAVLSPEGGIFATLAGRYSGTPNLEVFLKGHSGDLLRVDRKGRPPEHVTAPALTLGLAVQPEMLTDHRRHARLPRPRPARPHPLLPAHLDRRPPPDRHPAAARRRRRGLRQQPARPGPRPSPTGPTPPSSRSPPTPRRAVLQFEAELEPQLAPGAALAHVTDWAGKLTGTIARLAGLLHLAGHLRAGWTAPDHPPPRRRRRPARAATTSPTPWPCST